VIRHLWWAAGVALVLGGLVLLLHASSGPAVPSDFGWYAYTPLNHDADWRMGWDDARGTSTGAGLVASWGQVAGCGVVAAGLLVLASGVGFLVGRRRPGAP
jgi:hypothetical protein